MSGSTLSPERVNKRLSRIFVQTFPAIDPAKVTEATQETVEGWDSIATLALISSIEEDFGVKIGYDRVASLHTYDDVYQLLKEKLG